MVGEPVGDLGMVREEIERPRERGRGGVVSREQQGQQVVADDRVGEWFAGLVGGADEGREDVRARVELRFTAATANEVENGEVDLVV
jgi:hypothetical protein